VTPMTMKNSDECNNTLGQKRPYRPVVIVHGLMTGDVSTMQHLAARIAEVSSLIKFPYLILYYI